MELSSGGPSMDTTTHSEWLRYAEHHISDAIFQQSRHIEFNVNKKSLLMQDTGQPCTPTDARNDIVRMPDTDIAMVGQRLDSSCVRICGDFIECYITTSEWVAGKGSVKGQPRPSNEEEANKRRKNSAMRAAKRAEKQVRRLVNTNRLTTMWTLTFAPDTPANRLKWDCTTYNQQSDYNFVKAAWKKFCRKLRKVHPDIKWLVVYELHDGTHTSDAKRGTYHLHFATDTRLDWNFVSETWKYGIVRFDDFTKPKKGARPDAVRNPGAYMSKYIGKNFDESNFHVKRYSRSRNMETPYKTDLRALLEMFPGLKNLEIVFHTQRKHEYEGKLYHNTNITFRRVTP